MTNFCSSFTFTYVTRWKLYGKIVVSFEVLSAFSTFDVLYFFCMTKTTLQYNNVGGQTDQQKCVLIEWTLQRARTPKI